MKRKNIGVTLVTDKETPAIFAKMPLFNVSVADLSPNESLILSWISVSKFEGLGINRKAVDSMNRVRTSYSDIGLAVGADRRVVKRTLDSLEEKGLITILQHDKELFISYHLKVFGEFRMVAKTLIASRIMSFKLKGFIISMLLTTRDYVIEFKNVKHVSEIVGLNRRTVKKYYDELLNLGFLVEGDGTMIIDMREMFITAADSNVDSMLAAEKRALVAEKKAAELENKVLQLATQLEEVTKIVALFKEEQLKLK